MHFRLPPPLPSLQTAQAAERVAQGARGACVRVRRVRRVTAGGNREALNEWAFALGVARWLLAGIFSF